MTFPDNDRMAPRYYRTGLRHRRLFVVVAVLLGVAGIGTAMAVDLGGKPDDQPFVCTVTSGTTTYTLLPEQMANAATISSEATKAGLVDHAVTVALATALQESKLRNLSYGDLDSIGLFQQRPSQGWGTPEQLMQPSYAAAAFYRALAKIPDWATLDVAVAAQRVQRSADGSAYVRWENEARALATALTGQKAAGVACSGGQATFRDSAAAVAAKATAALGSDAFAAGVPAATGWRTAAYLVANTGTEGITSVSYAGQTWTLARGTWRADGAAGSQVTFTVARTPAVPATSAAQ